LVVYISNLPIERLHINFVLFEKKKTTFKLWLSSKSDGITRAGAGAGDHANLAWSDFVPQ
jgi:hypothetical protein